MMRLLGVTPDENHDFSGIPAGYPAYGIPQSPQRMLHPNSFEMSSMVDASTGQYGMEYPMMPVMENETDWGAYLRNGGGESSYSSSSRPSSACSGSSYSSSEGYML